ncbi:MAG: growth inhibitor PemK [Phenylobacterium sp.]|uniref:growth inhibitor PemK n=1 Tax=Phenylobacterium sp. TaxID=1871053 RepID=UPI0027159FE3|nr:growth inhibitor PemK [Phenylobacterium sp.]MDO8412053.1 growth inhibitor PemK [Phenylobacterium sp.]
MAIGDDEGGQVVYALPITHTPPSEPEDAVELPLATKARLGLDSARSWIVVSEGNSFIWPGPDLRPTPGQGPESVAYGMLPPGLFAQVKARFLAQVQARRSGMVKRTE